MIRIDDKDDTFQLAGSSRFIAGIRGILKLKYLLSPTLVRLKWASNTHTLKAWQFLQWWTRGCQFSFRITSNVISMFNYMNRKRYQIRSIIKLWILVTSYSIVITRISNYNWEFCIGICTELPFEDETVTFVDLWVPLLRPLSIMFREVTSETAKNTNLLCFLTWSHDFEKCVFL